MLEYNYIHNVSCEEGIPLLGNESIDLIVTSPPYNVKLGNNRKNFNPYDIYVDDKPYYEFINWLKNIFSKCYSKLKTGGRVCINIGNGKNGKVPTVADIINFMTDMNYLLSAQIIWNKNQTSHRAAWGSWLSPSSPSYPTPFEFILIFCKNSYKLQRKGDTDLTDEEFKKWAYALWEFKPETKAKQLGHPSPFPEELPKRCIKMNSWIGATVLDPFAGIGTTIKVAKELGRKGIGFEISKDYCEIANNRIM